MINSIIKRTGITVSTLLFYFYSKAQENGVSKNSLDESLRSHDKIYVVMAVCLVILVAFFIYLVRIDLKISKKEKTTFDNPD